MIVRILFHQTSETCPQYLCLPNPTLLIYQMSETGLQHLHLHLRGPILLIHQMNKTGPQHLHLHQNDTRLRISDALYPKSILRLYPPKLSFPN